MAETGEVIKFALCCAALESHMHTHVWAHNLQWIRGDARLKEVEFDIVRWSSGQFHTDIEIVKMKSSSSLDSINDVASRDIAMS